VIAVDSEEKLDKLLETTTDTRLAVATLAGEVRSVSGQIQRHDLVNADVEARLRAVERKQWALPSAATLIGLAGLVLAAWTAWGR